MRRIEAHVLGFLGDLAQRLASYCRRRLTCMVREIEDSPTKPIRLPRK